MIGFCTSRRGGTWETLYIIVRGRIATRTQRRETLLVEVAVFVTTIFLLIANDDRGVEPKCVSNPVQNI